GDAQQVLRGRGAEHRIDVDALLEEFLAQAAEVDFVLEHHGDDGSFAGEHVEAAGAQFLAQNAGDAEQVVAPFRLLLHDVQGGGDSGHRGRGQAGGKDEGAGGVLEIINYGALGGDESADGGQRFAEGAHDDIDFVEHAQVLGGAGAGGAEHADPVGFVDVGAGA